jgi:hypothetical protein
MSNELNRNFFKGGSTNGQKHMNKTSSLAIRNCKSKPF